VVRDTSTRVPWSRKSRDTSTHGQFRWDTASPVIRLKLRRQFCGAEVSQSVLMPKCPAPDLIATSSATVDCSVCGLVASVFTRRLVRRSFSCNARCSSDRQLVFSVMYEISRKLSAKCNHALTFRRSIACCLHLTANWTELHGRSTVERLRTAHEIIRYEIIAFESLLFCLIISLLKSYRFRD